MGKQHDELVDWSRRNWEQVAHHVLRGPRRRMTLIGQPTVELILADGRSSIDLYFEFFVDYGCSAEARVRRQEDWEAETGCLDNHASHLDEDQANRLYGVNLEQMLPKARHYSWESRPEYPWRSLGPKKHACLFPHSLICEIKPEINDAGATLRQAKQYTQMLRYKTDPHTRDLPRRVVAYDGLRYELPLRHSAVIVSPDERRDDLIESQNIPVFHPPGFGRRPAATTSKLDAFQT
jgi:hypothetical protein